MKHTLLFVSLLALSHSVFARPCVTNEQGEVDYKTICSIDASSHMLKQCKEVKVPGLNPGTIKYISVPKKIGWGNIITAALQCDITIHECKELAKKYLDEYVAQDECGQSSNMKKVKFEYQVMNELTLEFKRIHKETIKK